MADRTPDRSTELSLGSRATLHDGSEIPFLGLGVYQSPAGRATQDAVRYALEVGYRHVDTARIYGNERDVGLAVRESGVSRDEIFVTTKLWNTDHGYDAAIRACERSLRELGLSYVDLYLIHWPVPDRRIETWKALGELAKRGLARSIGVSNFTIGHLEELLDATDLVPAVNQVEFSPFTYQKALLEYCRDHRIRLEAYSPLTKGYRLAHPTLREIASRAGKTPAQVLLRWGLQHDVVVIPKSNRRERILENSRVFSFSLSARDMGILDGLDEGLRTGWDPTGAP
jgi:diketogulonate reductase-like aldo/keto reductase